MITALISLLAMGKLFLSDDIAFGFIAYALVLGRLCYNAIEGNRWHPHFCSIFAKYDVKVKALEAALADKQGNKNA